MKVFAFCLFVFVFIPRPADAATYYVANTGSDSNPGTLTGPFRTMTRGVSVLKAGDTLYVRAGTYVEAFNNNIPSGTSWSAPVTVAAYQGETVTVQPSSASANAVFYFAGAAARYIIIDGFIIDGINLNGGAYNGVTMQYITAPVTDDANHIRISNCEIKNMSNNGVGGGQDSEFINLNIHHNGRGASFETYGFYITRANNLVDRAVVHDQTGYCILFYNSGATLTNNNTVRNSTAYNCGFTGIGLMTGTGNQAYNNIVYNSSGGIDCAYAATCSIFNNTIYGNSGGLYQGVGIKIEVLQGVSAVVRNNISYNNTTDWCPVDNNGLCQYSGPNVTQDHNLFGANPQFKDPASKDFHLTASSTAAIDRGMTVSTVSTDMGGMPRPQDAAYDIGAFEFSAGTASIAPPQNLHVVP